MVHASLFSGIGGPEVAAAMLGWHNAFHCEINDFCRKILEYWFPNSKSYENIIETDFTEWRGKVDVLTGGFPCQPFSYAGQRKGHEDDRYLWPQMLRAITEIRPTWVIGENVAGLTTMAEQEKISEVGCEESLFEEGDGLYYYRQRQIFTIERVCRDLEGAGYSVQPVIIPACAVGAPHRRDRIFIIANFTNTTSIGRREIHEQVESEISNGEKSVGNGGICTIANNNGTRLQKKRLGRWHSFPSVSPIHRGNDGLPFNVDHLTISFSKWRTESLKAYGNAIVPQVMYEIFFAIEKIEKGEI